MKKKIKIIFILPTLKAGGAERVISFVATNLDLRKFKSILIVVGKKEDTAYYTENIEVKYLNKKRVLHGIPILFKHILFSKPDIVVGSISHINKVIALFSLFLRKIKFVGREAGVLSVMNTYGISKPKVLTFPMTKYHNYLDIIICQSKDILNDIKENITVKHSKLVIINNPITADFYLKDHIIYRKTDIIRYITVGSLHKRKGHIRLLNLLKKVNHPFHYTIIGNGDELENIKNCINQSNLYDKITLIPYTSNVSHYLRNSNLFLNGSFVEGFPNVFLESCAVGTPVISFDSPGGINEIILEGINGHIVNSEKKYIQKLNEINKNYTFKPDVVNNSVVSRYSKEHIISKYQNLFESLAKNKTK
ncbi:glycosyltransferase [Flavobacteriaceae bacterium]|nr:glycosyltransferase [Flavobacteriaceae bacterium]MDC0957239.1 glycosyltransferase [Flavobacteriaceae bacterium]MDC3326681.1 glycosyltransferase [Flavobacteriaceae bacterium]